MNLDFFFAFKALDVLGRGLATTLYLTFWANMIGVSAGFLVALATRTRFAPLRWLAVAYIELFRCTPILLQIVWFFFCVPIIFDVYWPGELLGLLVLGLNITAFNAEAYRAAIQAVPAAHSDAAIALGLSPLARTLHVILPQAIRIASPVLISNAIGIFQQSALVALVGVGDLMYEAKRLSTQTYRPIEAYTTVALMYLAVALPVGRLAAWIERRNERFR